MATEYRDAVGSDNIAVGNLGSDTIDPSSVGSSGSEPDGDGTRKRKRRSDAGQPRSGSGPKRAGTAKTSQKVALDLGAITGMFVGLHAVLAERTNTPEIAITEDEGKQFMQAAQNVMRHYSVETTQKTLDWVAFFGCASSMYMPRIAAVGMRKRATARKSGPRPQAAPGQSGAGMGAGVVSIVPDMTGNAGFSEG